MLSSGRGSISSASTDDGVCWWDSMKFHAPSSPWYGRTNAEVWFRSTDAAEAAGFANAEATESTDGESGDA